MIRHLLALAAALTLTACSSLKTSFDYDREYDFSGLREYAWMEDADGSLTIRRVRQAVDELLEARGFEKEATGADFVLAAAVDSRERVQVTDYGYSWGRWGAPYGPRDVRVYEYEEGTLVLDVFDAGTRSLVWRGVASKPIEASWSPERREKEVRAAVTELLAKFPPGR